MTLKEIYDDVRRQPKPETPASAFLKQIAEITMKSEIAVRRWLSGDTEPDDLTKSVLAEHFNTTPEALFPHKS